MNYQKNKASYFAPEVKVQELKTEGIICTSGVDPLVFTIDGIDATRESYVFTDGWL